MNRVVFFLLLTAALLAEPPIVFVHLGKWLPEHVPYTISQAKKFNPNSPIYLIANEQALWKWQKSIEATLVTAESLMMTRDHQYFRTHSRLNRGSANGLWFYSTERFFYVLELMNERNLSDVIHLENDILLYSDLSELIPAFRKHYSKMIGATFEQDLRCVAGILYIPTIEPLNELLRFINARVVKEETDMTSMGTFKSLFKGVWIDHLPTIPPDYVRDFKPLSTLTGIGSEESDAYANHFDDFGSLFDAACCGIFIGGDDPAYHEITGPGRIHPSSMLHMSRCELVWEPDSKGRSVPFLVYNGNKTKLNNLHMTNKTLISKMVTGRTE